MTAVIPRRRKSLRMARLEYALSARTRWGRVRGLPAPTRSTRRLASRCSNTGASLACPAETTTTNGRPPPSTRWWILLVKPPRERPIPWSGGSMRAVV